MNDAIAAVAKPLAAIPVKIRQALYALFGLIVIVDSIWNLLPDDVDTKVLATWGVFNSIMALGNSATTPPPPPGGGAVPEQYPGEFP